jgi:hypothetical protein
MRCGHNLIYKGVHCPPFEPGMPTGRVGWALPTPIGVGVGIGIGIDSDTDPDPDYDPYRDRDAFVLY